MKRLATIFIVAAAVSGATPLTATAGTGKATCSTTSDTWPLSVLPLNIPYC